ncbi:helix-turn-helix transcriptional regulator [Acidovorax sp. Root217]|uniref:helix-turn-helix domain-containing protein n=1 Tax=Acidovorax sp. Root217 TaxID=1736492 RepID=UPI0009E7B98D|nr:helix-turn-helix transcriptional regulator [Acidovorax sp. Root217]
MEIYDLGQLRKSAGLTQVQVAEALSLSQPQVSRYEADPSEASMKLVKAWTELCGDVRKTRGITIEPDNKRKKLEDALHDLYGWFKFAPQTQGIPDLPDLLQMHAMIANMARKPRMAVAGKFDTGKSTLLNYLLGGKHLPTAYQPTTSLVCHIRHLDDKPSWQTEPVWIMGQGYNMSSPDDQQNAEAHKLFAGGYDTLKTYAQHPGRATEDFRPPVAIEGAVAALVYIKAPVLEAVDFIDLPGYENDESDSQKAGLVGGVFDSLIYTSTVSGFFGGQDMVYLRVLLDQLPALYTIKYAAPLANLFVVCTQIHAITADADGQSRAQILHGVFESAVVRSEHQLAEALFDASKRWNTNITADTLRARMFGFAVDDSTSQITDELLVDLKQYIGSTAPLTAYERIKHSLEDGRSSQTAALSALAGRFEQGISDRESAQKQYDEYSAKKELSKAKFSIESQRLNRMIDEHLDTTQKIVKSVYSKYIQLEFIEAEVRQNYKDKKDAEKYLGGFLIDKVQRDINRQVSVLSDNLNAELSRVLSSMENYLTPVGSVMRFDAQSAFLSALTGVGAAGALAGWAAAVAGGSNLGGYILAAKIVGWLSSMGISVGGPAAVMTVISALGGPVTIAIGIGALLAAGLFALLGSDWQRRIAKKTVEQFEKEKVEDQIVVSLRKYWKDTKVALNHSMAGTLNSYDVYLAQLERSLAMSKEELNHRLESIRNVEAFIRTMPTIPETV